MSRKNVEDIYPLSPLQQGILFHTLLASEASEPGVYFVQHAWTVEGRLDVAALQRAFQEVVDRHPILRTAFVWDRRDRPLQVVRESVRLPFEQVDLRGLGADAQGARVEELAAADRARGFDLARAPLMRVAVLRLRDDLHRVVWSLHHLLLDGWSTPLATREVFGVYEALARGREAPRLERPRPYGDYIGWLQKQDPARAEAFFREALRGLRAPTPLGVDRPAVAGGGEAFDDRRLALPEATAERLGAFARQHQLTASTVLQAAWALVLSRYSGEEDVLFGVTVSGRSAPVPGIEKMVGLFINTLPVRVRVPGGATALGWLQGLQAAQGELRELEHTSLVDVQGWSEVPRGTPLFESILVVENYPFDPDAGEGPRALAVRAERSHDRASSPLTVVAALRRGLLLRISYDRRRFDDGTVERMLGHLAAVIEALLADPRRPLWQVSLMGEAEREAVLHAFNPAVEIPARGCVHRLFEAQVDRAPEAPAVTCEGRTLTYRELDERANRLAHHLRALGVGPGALVGLAVSRSLELVVGILGILKAGGAYLPLDPEYPAERLAFMVEDAAVRVLVTEGAGEVPAGAATVVRLDADWPAIAVGPAGRLPGGSVDDLAYVIYTSGSTGKPKGVMVTHANVARLFDATDGWYGFGARDVWTLFHSYAFDFSVWEIWGALLYGGRVVVVPYWVSRSPEAFHGLLRAEGITVLNQTPSAFRQLARAEESLDAAAIAALRLRYVIFGGEALDLGELRGWWDRHGDATPQLVNMYGITETTVHVTYRPVGLADLTGSSPASVIGRPLPDLQVYVLDAHRQPVPFGVAGELYVGGAGVSRGYLNRAELTAERFVGDTIRPAREGARLYRTGDRARRQASGDLEYLGRLDHQVKIRGFRIELGEVEAALAEHPAVREAVVLARAWGDERRLVAYVVVAAGSRGAIGELRGFLAQRLPDHLVPSAFVPLEALPLTENGKVDRGALAALPAPEAGGSAGRAVVPPRGPVEEALAGIFAETLKLEGWAVGAHDGFFELGGHSLLATSAIGRIRAAFSIDLPLRALFEASTPADLAVVVQAALAGGAAVAPPIERAPAGAAPALSFAQERLWFLAQLEPDDASYHVPLSLRLDGPLDVGALGRALSEIVRRHEVLRTAIRDVEGRPVAVVLDAVEVPLTVRQVEDDAAGREASEEARRPFDLAGGRPVRAALLALGGGGHQLLLTMHHLVSDGWSLGVLYRELSCLYAAFAGGQTSPLAELPIQYADYAAWQRRWFEGDVFERELGWWRKRLEGAPRVLELPGDRPRPPVPSHRGAVVAFAVDAATVKAARELSRRRGVTPFMTLLAAFGVLLHRYTGQTDLLVGTPIAGRARAETEGLIGFFVNTLVLRTELAAELPFEDLLHRVREACLGAYTHQDLPFEQLVRALEPDRDPSRSPLFQVSFTLQAEPVALPSLGGVTVRRAAGASATAKFDLTLALFDGPTGMGGVIEYATDLFDAPTVERMAGHYAILLAGAARAPERRLFELPLLDAGETERVVVTCNATAAPWPEDATIHELFEAQVDRAPDAVALVFEERSLTYGELDRRANQVAHRLRALGVGAESLVGVSMRRSPEMVVAVLGTLKAGGAWVPLDPAYPADRLAFMVEDAGLAVVLRLDATWAAIDPEPETRPAAGVTGESAAYVIYTSGSTGRPKGVVVEHRGLGNVAAVHRRAFGVGPGSRVLQFSSLSFDASVWEIVMALLNGATLVLAPQEALLPGPELLGTLARHAVTVMTLPPSVLAALPHAALPALETLVVAGEACSEELVGRWAPGRRLWNAYGPTEATICASMAECFAGGGRPTIGGPIANAQMYVVDAHLQPAPIGVPGELCLGGVGLARGYLRRPELTAEKFVQSPFERGKRLYRSGDLARRLPGGEVELIGRIDHQVKVRGFRIELGEIDAALRGHPGVADAITLAREDRPGDRRLVAYVVAASEPGPSVGELRAFLGGRLPEHMVPSAFVRLAAMPLTSNGKVDRRALPAPEAPERAHVAPRGPVEEAIAGVFAEVLQVAQVGAHDGFFELGGHSLLATQAMARVRAAFSVELPLRALFEAPTPAGLAVAVQAALDDGRGRGLEAPPLVRVSRHGELPLSFAQERLWFLAQLELGDPSYVIPSAVRLRGRLDVGALGAALAEIARRHEVLRTGFPSRGGRPVQRVHDAVRVELRVTEAGALPGADRVAAVREAASAEALAPFDLAAGPLWRARLLRFDDEDHALVVVIHHIVSDGWSQGIFDRELGALYEAFAAGRPSPLPELAVQYVDHAVWQRGWLSGSVFERQLAYWKQQLAGAPRGLELPADHARPAVPSHHGGRRRFVAPAAVAGALGAMGRGEGATLFMVLLAAFEVLLHRTTGERDVVVGTPIAGRTRAETEGLVGLFVNNLVLRTEVSGELTFREVVRRVREVCLGAYAHQDLPFERLVQELAPERDLSRAPLFQVMFTLQNEPSAALGLAGVDVERLPADAPTAKLDLSLALAAGPGGLGGVVEYATDLFEAVTIDRLVAHLGTLLAGVAASPDARVGEVSILDDDERRLIARWNVAADDPVVGECIHELFEAQVDRAPDAVALVFEERSLTYGELDRRANQVAHRLRALGVGAESLVGVSMRRSPEMVVAVLGTLKAGGAWVPLDPAYPADRLAFMVEDAGLAVVLRLDATWAAIDAEPETRPAAGATGESAAYVIYTSGSTGRPKGVVVEHRGLGNVAAVHRRAFGVGPGSRVLQLASASFDASVWELVMALLNGAALVLAPEEALLDLPGVLARHTVTVMTVSPSVLAALPHTALPALGTIVVAGEACAQDLVDRWAPGRRFWNAYGPTEATIAASMAECFAGGGKPPIGRPIAGAQLHVLDAAGEPAPIGVPGELFLGGVGLARGYLRRPELTAERFVPSPYRPGERLYRTGDRARWLAGGDVEFLGRVDHQVKVRGFRIELGEIDAALRGHPGVTDAVTVLRDGRLVAYVVAAAAPAELRAYLLGMLPEHLVPSALVALAALPLTPSGKVDRRALSALEVAAPESGYVAPRGPVEEALAAVFAEVLHVPQVGAHDGFFDLGGHSLLATQAVARVRAAFGIELGLRALFDAPSPAALAVAVHAALAEDAGVAAPPLVAEGARQGGEAPLSFAQERLWFLDQLQPDSTAYVIALAWRLVGTLDVGALRGALSEMARRHEVLRTTFAMREGGPVAVVHPAGEVALPVVRRPVPEADRDAEARRVAEEEGRRPVRLSEGPLFRARLVELGDDDHALVVTMHHVVADGWASGVMNRELGTLYEAFAAGRASPLPELPIQYADYAAWQRRWLQGEVLDRQLAYWKAQLDGAPSALELPTDRPRPPVLTYAGAVRSALVAAGVVEALKELGREQGATLFMTLLAAFDVLLARLTGQEDLVVGTPVANRTHAETELLLGFFVNTLALRTRLGSDRTFVELLARVREACLGAYAHQDTPFERLVQELEPARDQSRSPVFQVVFSMANAPREELALPGLAMRALGAGTTTAKYDLTLSVVEAAAGGLVTSLEYRTDLFDEATVDRMLGHLGVLLGDLAARPRARLRELAILAPEERRRLLAGEASSFPARACLHELFEAQVDRTPDAAAVTFEGAHLSYRELDERANRLAHALRRRGVGPEVLVGLCLPRSAELVVGILGILKAGGAYVPLDPEYPAERLAFMVEDSGVAVVLHQADVEADALAAEPSSRLPGAATPESLAYVIYTSGSTGKPKGAMVTHVNVARLFDATDGWYGFGASDVWTLFHSCAFDFSVWEIWGALLYGGRVVVVPYWVSRSPEAFHALLRAEGVTVLSQTPSAFRGLVRAEEALDAAAIAALRLRWVVFGGEALALDDLRPWWARHGDARPRLVNMYGITETTVHVTHRPLGAADLGRGSVIGRPLADLRVYVLDPYGEPVPVGVAGEIHVGGAGVCRGYLGRPELTAERFVDDPFHEGGRLYRSGDQARWLASGELEYLGRLDQQVKLRGFRIELGEIEAALALHEAVREAVVLAREDTPGDRRLVAYYVAAEPAPAAGALRAFLGERLPDHMVPSAFVALAALPLTANGKLDRKALPVPDARAAEGALVAPRGPIEEALAGIWAEVLGVGPIGVNDDFFALGGHSLLATQVMGRIGAALSVELPLQSLFEAPTVAGLGARVAAALEAGHGLVAPPLVRAARGEAPALSFAQERLWFLDQLEPGDASYIVPAAFRLEGPLDERALAGALTEIVRRHEVLRTSFAVASGKPAAVVRAPMAVELPVTRWPGLSLAEREEAARREIAAESRRPFDLAAAPMLRARLLELGDDDHVLSLTVHHIVSDAWTVGVLNRELAALYEAFAAGRASPLAELAVQYADYAAWQRRWLSGDVLERQLAYWKAELAGAPGALELPTDRPRPPVQTHAGGRRTAVFPPALLDAVKALARREGATLFMVLLAAFDVLLARFTGQDDVVVGSPIANRTRAETEPLVGFFVNTLVLRARLPGEGSFRELVRRVRESCLGAYAHQDMPFERLVNELAPDRDLARTPLFQVMFALQNAGGGGVALPGLVVRGFGADALAAKFELTLVMGEAQGGLVASIEFNTDLFDAATVDRMLGHLRVLLEGAVTDPDARVWELPLVPVEEGREVVADFPSRACLHELFEAQVDRAPDAVALSCEGRGLTYRELDEQANRVAHALLKRGVGPEVLVGLRVGRSLGLVVGLLGILKAGGAYVPLDPEYPAERLAFMVADSGVAVVLTEEDVDAGALAAEPSGRLPRRATPESLAYVIYTSGSTGRPKGAMVAHHNVVRLFEATERSFQFAPSDVWTLFHSYAFDFSVWEIWGALLYGGRVVVVPYWVSRSPEAFHALLRAEGVTVLSQTPSAFRQLVRAEEALDAAAVSALRLRWVVFGGEALALDDLRPWWARHGDARPRLVNMYGITETTVHVTCRPLGTADLGRGSVIGRPIADLHLYVLDPRGQPVPIGVAGELYVGGAGVSRGYLERPELTAERFVPDPFRPGGLRLYRTGDLVRRLASGDLEYLGRIDHQVKLRGFRIELGEIEAVLAQHPSVRESVVLARDDAPGDRRLVAYLVCFDGPRPTAGELRAFAQRKLPDVMVPAAFVLLDALPLTAQGKIDRRALPAPDEGERAAPGEDFAAPSSAVEEQLAGIWASVLRLERVGVHDNFFELGGDSILSIQIVALARQAGIRVAPRLLFQHPTIAELAAVAGTAREVSAEQGAVTGPAPITPIQRWWLDQSVAEPQHWNQAFFLELREAMDPAALEEAVAALMDHHDALRLRLAATEAGPRQTLAAPGGRAPFQRVDVAGLAGGAVEEAAAAAQASLDLASGPLVRVVLFDAGPTRPQRLLLVVHHLAVDGVSWRVLLEDLWTAHEQRRRGEAVVLPPKTTSFQRWGERLADHARSKAVEAEAAYWLADVRRRAAALPVDRDGGENTEGSARSVVGSLSAEETEALLREVPEAYQTQINDILLTALAQAWQGWTGSPVALVDLEGHGREALFEDVDLTRTVGWFTALYPLVLELPEGGGPGAAIKAVKEQVRGVPGRGVGHGLLRYLRAGDPVAAALSALPQAEASFNYLGQLDQALPAASPFGWARASAGPSHSPRARRRYLVEVTASVAGGRLSVQWTYSEARHERATLEALAAGFLAALRGLIAHCLSPEAGGYTPSDFQERGLSQGVIDMLAGLEDEEDA